MNRLAVVLGPIRCSAVPLLLLPLASCGVPLSTMHGPVPVPANTGAGVVGFGPVFLADDADLDPLGFALLFGGFASLRTGVSERVEVGGSLGVFHGLTAEAKYNFVPGPVHVSGNLAVSTRSVIALPGYDQSTEGIGFHPALLVGTERFHGGAKLLMFRTRAPFRLWPVVFAGGSIGGGPARLVPEIAWFHNPVTGEGSWFGGIGVQRTTGELRGPPPWRRAPGARPGAMGGASRNDD